jgi:anti-sigma factor RsiW
MPEKHGAKPDAADAASSGSAGKASPMRAADDAATAVCPDAVTLAGYLDGKLSGEETALLEAHLARCAKCRLEVKELREILAAGDIDPDDPAQREALDDLMKKAKGLIPK